MPLTRQMDAQQRSAVAVREFKKMLPGLTAFVRALTGKRTMRVEMGAQSGTDGRRVIIRPPLALADSATHERALCDLREDDQLLCPACARLEEVYVVIYHEVSHNVAKSMENFHPTELAPIAIKAATEHGSPEFAKFILERTQATAGHGMDDVYGYGMKLSDYLLGFIRGIDDYRIDRASYIARPGVEAMRHHQTEIILNKGLENQDGSFSRWSDAPLEAQIPIAILVGKQGHKLSGRFDERIEQLFQLPQFQKLLAEPISDMFDVLSASVSFLGELNKLGLYDLPLPPPPVPPMPMEADPEPGEGSGESDDDSEQDDPGSGTGNSGKPSNESSSDEPENSEDVEPAEDTSQQGEKEGQDAGNGRGTGNGNSADSDPDNADPDSNNSAGGDSSQNDKSIADPAAGVEQGGAEDNTRPDDTNYDSDSVDGESENVEEDSGDGDTDAEEFDVDPSTESPAESGNDSGDAETGGEPLLDSDSTDKEESETAGDDTGDSRSENQDNENGEEESDPVNPGVAEIVGTTDQGPDFSDVDHASAEEIREAMEQASGHAEAAVILGGGHSHGAEEDDDDSDDDVMEQAVTKALVFDDANTTVLGQKVFTNGKHSVGWGKYSDRRATLFRPMQRKELSPSILHARRIFSDSKLDKNVRNLKRGKLATAKLGARAWNNQDDRLFQKKIRANGIDDELVIAMDLSGSTSSRWDRYIKQTAYAMAEVVHSVGVKFSIYGHTTDAAWDTREFTQHLYEVKNVSDPWGPVQKDLLARLGGMEGSLDGHNLEFYRKVLMRSTARRKTLVYYTDGQIPETNSAEEAVIITRELALYRKLGIGILVVCFGTDGPKRYGLDTIKIKGADDIVTVIKELESRLTR